MTLTEVGKPILKVGGSLQRAEVWTELRGLSELRTLFIFPLPDCRCSVASCLMPPCLPHLEECP